MIEGASLKYESKFYPIDVEIQNTCLSMACQHIEAASNKNGTVC